MKKIEIDELKKIQIEILDYIDSFCKKNKITYWLDGGTLLGAIRHKGYIPWDDDIDIGMTRDDYEKFTNLFNKNNKSKYHFSCFENEKGWPYSFGKVLDTSTIMYEPNKKLGIKTSVFVDVFPHDNVPDDINSINKMVKKRDFYLKLNSLQKFKGFYNTKKEKFNFIRYPLHIIMKVFPDGYFVKKNVKLATSYRNVNTNTTGTMMDKTVQYCSKDILDSFIEVTFEKKKYPAPARYDEWLRSYYGDYMELPPEEQQVSHHRFEAYHKEGM